MHRRCVASVHGKPADPFGFVPGRPEVRCPPWERAAGLAEDDGMSRKSPTVPKAIVLLGFVALLLAFVPIFDVFVARPVAPLLPVTDGWKSALAISVWVLAAAASITICRTVVRRVNRGPPTR